MKSLHSFPRHAAVSGDAILIAYSEEVEAISLTSGKRVATLATKVPAVPVLHFDGEEIEVRDSGEKPGFTIEGWAYDDPSWPHILTPQSVALDGGVLRILRGEQCHRFDALALTWTVERPPQVRFHELLPSRFSPTEETELKMTTIAGKYEVWHDSRGLLHLKTPVTPSAWSILLSVPSASVWNSSWGLLCNEPRLRTPEEDNPADLAVRSLQGVFNAMASDHDLAP